MATSEYCKSQPKSLYSLLGGRCWSSIPALNHLQAFLFWQDFLKGTKEVLAPRNLWLWELFAAELVSVHLIDLVEFFCSVNVYRCFFAIPCELLAPQRRVSYCLITYCMKIHLLLFALNWPPASFTWCSLVLILEKQANNPPLLLSTHYSLWSDCFLLFITSPSCIILVT